MNRMFGVLMVIVVVFVLVIWYAVTQWPVFYILETTGSSYTTIADDQGWDDKDDVNNTLAMIGWLFVGVPVVGSSLFIVYLFALAHKKEFDQS